MNSHKLFFTTNCLILASVVLAVSVPHIFLPNTPAEANQVNNNFATLADAINQNESYIATLEAKIMGLENTINTLITRVETLEQNTVIQLDEKLVLSNDETTAIFTGVNLQIVDGKGQTDGEPNGLGNVIIGYNEALNGPGENGRCSFSQYKTEATCLGSDGIWALSHRNGSHNLVVGMGHSYMRNSGIVAGRYNVIDFPDASVLGGYDNFSTGIHTVVVGGYKNEAIGTNSVISGGGFNETYGSQSTISGGRDGIAYGEGSSISGGRYNQTGIESDSDAGASSSVSGGLSNVAEGIFVGSSISGGINNTTKAFASNISGGINNTTEVNAAYSSISGGDNNTTKSSGSSISGGSNNTTESNASNSSISGGFNRTVEGIDDWRAGSLFEDK